MIDPDRVLQPIRDEAGALGRLDTYRSAEELAEALAAVWRATERTLRLLLRADEGAPDAARLAALSPADLSFEQLLSTLRRRDRLSMGLAGRIHEFERIAARAAGGGDVRAADADAALATVGELQEEVRGRRRPWDESASAPAPRGTESLPPEAVSAGGPSGMRAAVLIGALALAGAGAWLALAGRDGGDGLAEGIAAFRRGDFETAEVAFARAVQRDSGDVTALLYLARVHRRQGRFERAAAALGAAERRDGSDPFVRRELGYLFMDLDRPLAAAAQFDRARELDPGTAANWIGLVRALRAAGDARAEQVLREAPPEVRAALDRDG
jgi:tetratricopeptide (TPR) repeat protein